MQFHADLIFVIFSPQMYFLGSIFLHMKARKLWQNLPKFSQIFSKFPKISPHDNSFSRNIICELWYLWQIWALFSSVMKDFLSVPSENVKRERLLTSTIVECDALWQQPRGTYKRFSRRYKSSILLRPSFLPQVPTKIPMPSIFPTCLLEIVWIHWRQVKLLVLSKLYAGSFSYHPPLPRWSSICLGVW